MGGRFWRLAACALALALSLYGLWSLGVLGALAARLEPVSPGEPLPTQETEQTGLPSPLPEPSPTATIPPEPEPPSPATAAPVFARSELPRVDDRTSGHDLAALFAEGWSLTLPDSGPQVLILHSHSTEAYTPQGMDQYEASDPGRTLDKGQNVIRVGDELAAVLEEAGFTVVHDRELYDWPNYNGSYSRSRAAAEKWLEEQPGIRVVIDLHRDALNGKKTVYKLPEGTSAQVMLVLTTGDSGLYHPNWRENVKLGLELQAEMEAEEPGLSRPMLLSPARYNEQLSPGYLLLEVGSDANTLEEALEAVRRFGACAAAVLRRHLTNPQESASMGS